MSTIDLESKLGHEKTFALFDTDPEDMLWIDKERLKLMQDKNIYPKLSSLYDALIRILIGIVGMHTAKKQW